MNDEKGPNNWVRKCGSEYVGKHRSSAGRPPGKWEMPKPVFQKSTGYLPQGFQGVSPADPQIGVSTEEPTPAANIRAQGGAAAPVAAQEISESPNIQPQPDLSIEFSVDDAALPPLPVNKTRSPAVRLILILLGITAMVVFLLVFLAVIYYLFFYHPNESQVFY
jgi:hypothetical protein